MAFFYQLAVECGDEAAATACADHFSSPDALPGNTPVDLSVRQASNDGAWWTVIVPSEESESGVYSDAVARSLSAAGRALLQRLRDAPPFRFAVIGVEAEQSLGLADFDDRLGDAATLAEGRHGLVVSDPLLAKLGDLADLFEPFAPGYHWIAYRGERYVPDCSEDER